MIKIALVDDHTLVRDALAVLISRLAGCTVTMRAGDGFSLLQQLERKPLPDIVLLDIHMPGIGGVETAIVLRRQYPSIKVIALTMLTSEHVKQRMLRSGIRAYLYKDCDAAELEAALYSVYHHGYHFNEQFPADTPLQKPDYFQVPLNEQQRSFLRWASTDLTHREIAEKMNVSPRTVDSYRDSLFKKLDVNSRIGLVLYAIRNGFIHP